MATTIALTRATGRGNLVRSGSALETLSRVRAVAFDKTGTLTAGRPRVSHFHLIAGGPDGIDGCLVLAASVEREVTHPFARAIVASALERGGVLPPAAGVNVTAGGGAQGLVQGRSVMVGKPAWLASCGIALPDVLPGEGALSSVAIAIDGRLVGVLELDDPPRPEAGHVLAALRRLGVACLLLSGDREAAVAQVGGAVGGIDCRSDLSPTDKQAALRELRATHGVVAMVGDGVNDAPALGAADVGIAFGPAADLARENADVTILREDLNEVPRLLELARATFRIVRQNLAWAFSYNSIAVVVAAFGLLRPVFAAAAMVLSSVCVVGNSMRLGHAGAAAPANKRRCESEQRSRNYEIRAVGVDPDPGGV
jgi:P-type E1-E2 ATPase